ncbi:MAG: hypothetical protein HZA53_15750 [Planctomycetes bacterium]|nr:hypothetical protein [Planctomycetota bacterium]
MQREARCGACSALLLLLAACGSPARPAEHVDPAVELMEELFPAPRQGLALAADASLGRLVDDFAASTEWTVLADRDTRARIDATAAGLDRAQGVSARDVHRFVETLLVQHGYALSIASARTPRILRLVAMDGPNARGARANLLQVEPSRLGAWAREHPAFQLQAIVRAEHLDARAFANSMRPMVSDVNAQLVIPVGDGHELVLVGFAPWLAHVCDTLAALDRAQPPEAAPVQR